MVANTKNTREQNYERDDKRIRRMISRFLSGERKNPLICTKDNKVKEYEKAFGITLEFQSNVSKERGLSMYRIVA